MNLWNTFSPNSIKSGREGADSNCLCGLGIIAADEFAPNKACQECVGKEF